MQKLVRVASVLGTMATTSLAHSAEPRGVDWGKIVVDVDRFARTGFERPPVVPQPSQAARPTTSDEPNPQNLGNAWFGVAPRVTLVARDWGGSPLRLAGDRLSLCDAMRVSSSTRMVVGRARLSAARFTPFVQVGLGHWRLDRKYVPLIPQNYIEIATQLGTGLEVRLAPYWQIAAETSFTSLIVDHNSTVPQTLLWSTALASRIQF